jgi:prephenate dehydratase
MSGRKKIVFQGEPGANSHIAAREVYPDYQVVPCQTFEDCFAALQSGAADLGMIPVENSTAGRVVDIHNLLPSANLHIIGEYFLPVHHQLMALKGTKITDLKSVQSHPQALGQCRIRLRDWKLEAVVGADTAGSAREIAALGDPTRGAIASRLAAEIYGLDILAEDIQDEANNTTRFIILSPEPLRAAAGLGPIMTTFVFNVRNVPAALYKALGGFATGGVNMTRLESYMVGGHFTATQFLADIEGHPDERNVALAFEELAFFADYRILGVYRASSFRERARMPEAPPLRAIKGM